MKLMKMTDFVLSQEVKGMELQSLLHQQSSRANKYERIIRYAKFLTQSLTLDMFVGDKALFEKIYKDDESTIENQTIEDLLKDGIEFILTQHTIKQLGL